jgi:hypothetical protein
MMMTPTIRVGRETLWLDAEALRRGEFSLDHESLSEQCEGCGRDIAEQGEIARVLGGRAVRCIVCKTTYPVVDKDVR